MGHEQSEEVALDTPNDWGPELFIGLVGPVGADLERVVDYLSDALRQIHYAPEPLIHLSQYLRDADEQFANLPRAPLDVYIHKHMDAGNKLRQITGLNDAMAILGIGAIREERLAELRPEPGTVPRRAYIIRSLKHPDEARTLRHVYGSSFYLIAVHGTHHERRQHLAQQIADSHNSMEAVERYYAPAEDLIQRDLEEPDIPHGQNLRDTFHRADVFFDMGHSDAILRNEITRFVELIFGSPFLTPTKAEYAMFHAAAAALRSAEPGRQVGAAIATDDGDIIAVGTNEVPKSGGGMYWCDDQFDRRQFQLKFDSNQAQKRNLIAETLDYLKKAGWLVPELYSLSRDELLERAMYTAKPALPRRSQIRSLIEFGRAVHAEMAALIDAARRGVSVQDTTMYVTTFPCHLCARHVVAAGIKQVHYIEPYPKSLALALYPDSIALERADRTEQGHGQILFEPFFGVSPRRYFDLFTAPGRRDSHDKLMLFDADRASPRATAVERIYLTKEQLLLEALNAKLSGTLFPKNPN